MKRLSIIATALVLFVAVRINFPFVYKIIPICDRQFNNKRMEITLWLIEINFFYYLNVDGGIFLRIVFRKRPRHVRPPTPLGNFS